MAALLYCILMLNSNLLKLFKISDTDGSFMMDSSLMVKSA